MNKALFFVAVAVLGLCSAAPFEESDDRWDWRIVGGSNAPENAFPYQVALRTTGGSFFCGGFIISKRTIISAAHCLSGRVPSSYIALAGTTKLNSNEVILRPTGQLLHPQYSSSARRNDIALVFLGEDIVFTDAIKAIDIDRTGTDGGVEVVLSGWGRISAGGIIPNDLQFINLLTLDNPRCQSLIGALGTIHEEIICTLTRSGEGACNGDSGGPLVASGKVVGVVNWGSPCARGVPDMYARVSSFISWIDQNIQG